MAVVCHVNLRVSGALLDQAGVPAWSVLAALLAELKLGATGDAGSAWGPYIDALPVHNGCVLEWSSDEVGVPSLLI